MPNEHAFNELSRNHSPWVSCIYCEFAGRPWKLDDARQAEHAKEHFHLIHPENPQVFSIDTEGMRVQDCRVCGKPFAQARRRGRPALECESCHPRNTNRLEV